MNQPELVLKIAASVFIVLMSALLLLWCIPDYRGFREMLHGKLGWIVCWAGLDNYWALFAPEPVSQNFLIGFELEFADGLVRAWKLPAFTLRDDYQHARHIRYVKLHNQLLSQKDPLPREAICEYLIRAFQQAHPGEAAPVQVHILRYYEPAHAAVREVIPWLSVRAFSYPSSIENTPT